MTLETRMRGNLEMACLRLRQHKPPLSPDDPWTVAAELNRMLCEAQDDVAKGWSREDVLRRAATRSAAEGPRAL